MLVHAVEQELDGRAEPLRRRGRVIAGHRCYTVGGSLPLERELTSDRNTVLGHDSREAAPANARPAGDRDASLVLD